MQLENNQNAGGQRLLVVSAYVEHHIVVAFKRGDALKTLWSFWLVPLVFSAPPPSPLVSPFPLLTQCDGCLDDCAWGLTFGLQELPAMGACYCLGAGWSQRRPLGLPGYPSSTQFDAVVNTKIN